MVRTIKQNTIMVKNIDIRIKYAVGYSDYEIADICGMEVDTFRKQWRDVLDQEEYLKKQGYNTDAKDFMRNSVFCIKRIN